MASSAERYDRVLTFFDAGDYITAARSLAEVVAQTPAPPGARLLLARAYSRTHAQGRPAKPLDARWTSRSETMPVPRSTPAPCRPPAIFRATRQPNSGREPTRRQGERDEQP